MTDYPSYGEPTDAEIKTNAEVEKARINADTLKYERKLKGRESMREQGLIFSGIAAVAGVVLSLIWAAYMDMNADGVREDEMQSHCQSNDGVWLQVEYNDWTCVPKDADLEKLMYKDDD